MQVLKTRSLAAFALAIMMLLATSISSAAPAPLRISDNGRYLVHTDNSPFFYLGDTAWELFHRLNREEAESYLTNRAAHGFTVIQGVVLGEINGLKRGNAYNDKPFIDFDVTRPNEKYFAHVDWIVAQAAAKGLYVGMLPTWGRWVGGNDGDREHTNFLNVDNARGYATFLANRYKDQPIIWILGGDRQPTIAMAVWDEMAAGLRAVVGDTQLISYHPRTDSSGELHNKAWLNFNMIQSGHDPGSVNYGAIERDYALLPVKPCMDAEPAYEYPPDAMPENRPVGEVQVRRNAYWAVFAGAHGHTYGTHPIWQMYDEGREPRWDVVTPWHQAMNLPGASQMKHLKRLMRSRPFLTRIPDQRVIVSDNPDGLGHVQATRDGTANAKDATYLMVYFPTKQQALIDATVIAGEKLNSWWYNPRTGESTRIVENAVNHVAPFVPPADDSGPDWILIIDDASKGYKAP